MGIFSKNKNKLALVLHIGSSNVEGALFWSQESGVPRIIFSTTEPIVLEDKVDVDRFLILTMQALDLVMKKVSKAGMGIPKEIFCVLASPWHISQTRIINFKKNTPFVFTAKLAEDLIEKEVSLFENEHQTKKVSSDFPNRTIELKNIKTILNGYETLEPLNQKAKDLEMIIFVSISEEKVLKKIENIVSNYFHFEKIKFASFLLSDFTVVRDMYIEKENFLLLDIGGEVTNISMVKKNILRESISFPLGRKFLTRGISTKLRCTLNEANSLISLFKEGHAEAGVADKISLLMDDLMKEWLLEFQKSLANISNDISIPSTIYMTADKELSDLFSETIKIEQFNQYTLTDSKFEIIYLDKNLFHNIAFFTDSVVDGSNLVIDSVYINRFLI